MTLEQRARVTAEKIQDAVDPYAPGSTAELQAITQLVASALREQREEDAKAMCVYCRNGAHTLDGDGHKLYEGLNPVPCAAAAIRRQG